jgi:predicted neuraminidase
MVHLMKRRSVGGLILLLVGLNSQLGADLPLRAAATPDQIEAQPGYLKAQFLPATPHPFNHSASIVETPAGLMAAWVSGSRERAIDVGIWTSRQTEDGTWTKPVEAINGFSSQEGRQYPCWNPVLFRPKPGPLFLFYKVGPSPENWWGVMALSDDDGRSWTRQRRLPEGTYGPIKNKPVVLPDGSYLCPSSTENAGWRVHMEKTAELGLRWTRTGPLNNAREVAAIQPAILLRRYDGIQILCRTKQGAIYQSFSQDNGKTWTPMQRTALPNPNGALDAVMLQDETSLLVYNHSRTDRTPLNVAISKDGHTWRSALTLENQPGEYSYPSVIQAANGLVHLLYTWNKERIKHVTLNPEKFATKLMRDGG